MRIDEIMFRQLIANSSIPLIGSALACLLVVISQINSTQNSYVYIWLCLVLISIGIRIWFIHNSKNKLALHGYDSGAAFQHAMTTCLSGVAWGLGGIVIDTAGRFLDDVFQSGVFKFGAFDQIIQVGDISLMMLGIMVIKSLGGHMRRERVFGIRQCG